MRFFGADSFRWGDGVNSSGLRFLVDVGVGKGIEKLQAVKYIMKNYSGDVQCQIKRP